MTMTTKLEYHPSPPAEYLGDGAYVEWNRYAYVLYTSNGVERTNEIYLEPEHFRNLVKFKEREHLPG